MSVAPSPAANAPAIRPAAATRHGPAAPRLLKVFFALAVPLAVWFYPLAVTPRAHEALAISSFMIAAWMTEVMEYAAAGLIGLLCFWFFGVSKPEVIFSGFVSDASWFYLGAMLIGAMATKSGLPQRIANFVVSHVGVTYSRLLLGIILIDFLLTFIVPSGAACLVVMASIAIGVMNLFDLQKGSNIGRGLFLIITYTSSIFNKMIVAGTSSILSRGIIEKTGQVQISWGMWLLAFLPCAIVTILASWWLTLKLFPPEEDPFVGKEEKLRAHFRQAAPWTPVAVKSAILGGTALVLWMTDWLHHISASIVAFAIGLFGMLPFVDVLDENDFKRINLLPFFFVAAALGMGEVLKDTGGLDVLTDNFIGRIEPLLANKFAAVPALYWGGFIYHFFTASEISMLVTSLPILVEFSREHGINPTWTGMIWAFSSGGKLFAYQSSLLVLGFSYGYFRHTDLIKIGAALTLVEFVMLALSVIFYWPLLGLV